MNIKLESIEVMPSTIVVEPYKGKSIIQVYKDALLLCISEERDITFKFNERTHCLYFKEIKEAVSKYIVV